MEQLGYYAMDAKKNLYQFEWGVGEWDGLFYIIDLKGKTLANPDNYTILEIGYYTLDLTN